MPHKAKISDDKSSIANQLHNHKTDASSLGQIISNPQSTPQSQTSEAYSLQSFSKQIQNCMNESSKKFIQANFNDLIFNRDASSQHQTSKQLSNPKKLTKKRPQTLVQNNNLPNSQQSGNSFFDVFKNSPQGVLISNETEDTVKINIRCFQSKFIRELNFKENEKFRKSRKRVQINEKQKENFEVPQKKLQRTVKPYARKQMHEMWYNGIKIISEFKNQILHGQTEVYYPNGAKFIGRYELGIRIYGMFDFANGYVYTGGFLSDKFEGEGTITLPNGKIYSGEWSANVFVGKVDIKYPSGDVYFGEVKDFKKHGKGYLFFKSGQKFVGEFQNGNITGRGQYFVNGECIARGWWKNGELVQECNIQDDSFSIFDSMASCMPSRKSLNSESNLKIKSKVISEDEDDLVMDGIDEELVNIHVRSNGKMLSINDIALKNLSDDMSKQMNENWPIIIDSSHEENKNSQKSGETSKKIQNNFYQSSTKKRHKTKKTSSVTVLDPLTPHNGISEISCETTTNSIQTAQLMEICNDFQIMNSIKVDNPFETLQNNESNGSQGSVSSLLVFTGKFKSIGSTMQSQQLNGLLTLGSNE